MPDPATDAQAGAIRSLPPVARVVINERRKRILRTVEGRVLDPSGRSRPGSLRRADEVVSGSADAVARPGSFDVVVSVLWLSGVDDPVAALSVATDALDVGGELVFLELVPETGVGRHGQRLFSPLLHRAAGWRVDRDVPALLRAEGWSITDLERIDMPRYLWPVHGLVEGRARRRTSAS